MRNQDLQILIDRDKTGRYTVSAHEPGSTVVIGHFGSLDHAKKAARKLRKATRKGQDQAPIRVLEPTTLGYIFHE
jgi:hypothetical protein